MKRLSRVLAGRLQRLVTRSAVSADQSATADVWSRLDTLFCDDLASAGDVRRRELAQENARLAVTLIGQQGDRVVRRASSAGDCTGSADGSRFVLELARELGNTATRRAATAALDEGEITLQDAN